MAATDVCIWRVLYPSGARPICIDHYLQSKLDNILAKMIALVRTGLGSGVSLKDVTDSLEDGMSVPLKVVPILRYYLVLSWASCNTESEYLMLNYRDLCRVHGI